MNTVNTMFGTHRRRRSRSIHHTGHSLLYALFLSANERWRSPVHADVVVAQYGLVIKEVDLRRRRNMATTVARGKL